MARGKSSTRWLAEHFDDPYVKLAQKKGLRSRSAFKLLELQDKYPGLERVHVGCTRMGTPLEVILEQLERFVKQVMPAFKNQKA